MGLIGLAGNNFNESLLPAKWQFSNLRVSEMVKDQATGWGNPNDLRERQTAKGTHGECIFCIYSIIYIYIYLFRERETYIYNINIQQKQYTYKHREKTPKGDGLNKSPMVKRSSYQGIGG